MLRVVLVTLLPAGETDSHVLFPLLVVAVTVKFVAVLAVTASCWVAAAPFTAGVKVRDEVPRVRLPDPPPLETLLPTTSNATGMVRVVLVPAVVTLI